MKHVSGTEPVQRLPRRNEVLTYIIYIFFLGGGERDGYSILSGVDQRSVGLFRGQTAFLSPGVRSRQSSLLLLH